MFKSFLRYKYKTALILLSATSAIASIFLITALGNGIIGMYADMLKTDGDIIVMQRGVADTFFSDVNLTLADSIGQIEGVASAQGVIVGAGAIDIVPIAGIYGVTRNRMPNYILSKGAYPRKGEVMLGENIAAILNDPRQITLLGSTFRVSGSYKSEIGFENGGVVIDIADAQKLFNKSASFLLVSLSSIQKDSDAVVSKIQALSDKIDVKSTNEFIDNYNQFKIIRISSGVIASISFFMGFLAIVSLMSIMINDRRYEFGIRRALGIPKRAIILQIIIEVAAITLLAFFIAFGISLVLLDVLQNIEKFQGYLSGHIDPALFTELLIGSLGMAVIGALIPAVMAARVDPIILINRGQ
ncbi:FtsX-like permease family protein [bacterium]|jgi:putative ABC transport system permease protein|nr:FtsX-like permease family protein [bacterium]